MKINQILNFLTKFHIQHDYFGDNHVIINTFSSINELKDNTISWIKNGYSYNKEILLERKNVVVVTDDLSLKEFVNLNIITCSNPRQVYFTILSEFFPKKRLTSYISPTAIVESDKVNSSVYIGHNSYIGKLVILDEGVIIKNNVSIEGNVRIGKNTIIHSGVVIGTDGFGYYRNHNSVNTKIEHYGGVEIGENVEIGANTCIDQGTFESTKIGDNVKISNMCNISHNVVIESDVLITAGTIIAGSTTINKESYIAPGAVIMNKIELGEKSYVGMGSVVVNDVKANTLVLGVPAKQVKK